MIGQSRTFTPGFWSRLFGLQDWKLTLKSSSADRILFSDERNHEFPCLDVISVSKLKSLLSHGVEIRTKSGTYQFLGLNSAAATEIGTAVLIFINRYLALLIQGDESQVDLIDKRIRDVTDERKRYLARADIASVISEFPGDASKALSHPLFDPELLPGSSQFQLPESLKILTDRRARDRYNDVFLASELEQFRLFFDDLGGINLSGEQREACVRLEDNNLLVASAGSGKTATMVGKVAYVVEKQLYEPNEILVLAYNRSAAVELRERIAKQLQVEESELECKVTTFHALGREIIERSSGKPPQLANWVEHPVGEIRMIEKIIHELIGSDSEFHRMWMDLLTIYQRADLPVEYFDSEKDYQQYISTRAEKGAATVGTLAGVYVKSLEEQRIVDWLWLNSIQFEYEKQVAVTNEDGSIRHLHPDFYYPGSNTWHEHFAINADGTSPFPNYVLHAQAKRDSYHAAGFDFIETTSAQASDDTLFQHLAEAFQARDVTTQKRSWEEISNAIEPVIIRRYHNIISVCIKHIRANQFSLEMLRERAKSLYDKPRAKRFVEVVWRITEAYSRQLNEEGRIDFESMIADAVRLVETREYESSFKLLLIDEFQDISGPRANLVKACKQQQPFVKVFAVGDDWQSIYRFAGSDISIFTQFEANFGASWRGYLQQTYRCNQLLAETAADFVQRNPEQLKKTVRSTRQPVRRSIRVVPVKSKRDAPGFDVACKRLLARIDSFLEKNEARWRTNSDQKLKVLVLWRYNHLNPFKKRKPDLRNIEVDGMSFHRSKGLEADYTILLDVSEGDYGVPSRIEDDELLNLVIPEPETYQYAEERRLFYVALTRASRGTFLLVNERKPSRYVGELREIAGADVRFETVEGEELDVCPDCSMGALIERSGPNGSRFSGCTRYPVCRYTH